MQPIIDLIKKLAIQENKTHESTICKIAVAMLYNSNRKFSQIFQKLGEDPETKKFKFDIPKKEAIQMKIKMKLSVNQYNILREFLGQYLTIPSYSTIATEMKQLYPIMRDPFDFVINWKTVGNYWPIRDVIHNSLIDILERHHGESPERVEEELWIKGGLGGDGFSRCVDRVGKDIDKNTSSRYFVGIKIARIVGKRKFDASFTGPTEYFVETSQRFVSVKPLLIAEIKENHDNLHKIWTWVQEQWEMVKEFTIIFHGREIKVHFDNPKLIRDGKCFLQLLNLPCAYCYLCFILSEKAQSSKRLENRGFKIERSIEGMWNHVDNLTEEWRESDTKKAFKDFFTAKKKKIHGWLPNLQTWCFFYSYYTYHAFQDTCI